MFHVKQIRRFSLIFLLILVSCQKKQEVDYNSPVTPKGEEIKKDVHQIIRRRKSVRKFSEKPIPIGILEKIVEDGELAPSAGNTRPWDFVIVGKGRLEEIFKRIKWLKGNKPKKGEEPTAYIIILQDKKCLGWGGIASCAAAAENILLSATGYGIGSCWIGSVNEKEKLKEVFKAPENLEIFSVIALGYPKVDAKTGASP